MRGDAISGGLEDGQVAGERARTAGEIRETRRAQLSRERDGQPRHRDRSAVDSRMRAGRRHRPPTRCGSEAAAACSCRAELLHPARCVRRRAPLHRRARPRASAHLRRSTCAASRRDRNRDRARSCPRLREDARRRSGRHPVADPARAAGRPGDRESDPARRGIRHDPRAAASRSARTVACRRTDADAATGPRSRSSPDPATRP